MLKKSDLMAHLESLPEEFEAESLVTTINEFLPFTLTEEEIQGLLAARESYEKNGGIPWEEFEAEMMSWVRSN